MRATAAVSRFAAARRRPSGPTHATGYVPYSLQYDDYTATYARSVSIAGGDPMEKFTNRSFKGKTVKTYNRDDMLLVTNTKKEMGEKPVIVVLETGRPVVLSEIEPFADAILVSFNVQHQALLDIISGKAEPSRSGRSKIPVGFGSIRTEASNAGTRM